MRAEQDVPPLRGVTAIRLATMPTSRVFSAAGSLEEQADRLPVTAVPLPTRAKPVGASGTEKAWRDSKMSEQLRTWGELGVDLSDEYPAQRLTRAEAGEPAG